MSSFEVSVRVDPSQAIKLLMLGRMKLPYACANTANGMARAVQTAERERVRFKVKVRKTNFIERQIAIIKPFASVARGINYARVSIGERPRLFLADLEGGARRLPQGGRQAIAVPVTGTIARPTWSTPQPWPPLIRQLGLGSKRQGAVAGVFENERGVYQRTSRTSLTKLFVYVRRGVRVPPRLGWINSAREVAMRTGPALLEREVRLAFAFGRTR